MKNRMKCFIDFDGTLVCNKYRLYKFFIDNIDDMLKESLTIEEFWNLKRLGINEIDWLNSKYGINLDKNKWEEKKIKYIESKKYLQYNKLFDYTKKALLDLKKFFDLILVTRRNNQDNFYEEVEKYGIKDLFNDILIVKHGDCSKADIIKLNFNISDKDIIIGDTEDDIKAAVQLNIIGIFVRSGIRSEWIIQRYFKDYNKIICINNISEFKNISF